MTTRTAEYKGRAYTLLFLGRTKFGRRAKLAFTDGSKEFWVDASLVTERSTVYSACCRAEDDECEVCGQNKYNCGHCVGW